MSFSENTYEPAAARAMVKEGGFLRALANVAKYGGAFLAGSTAADDLMYNAGKDKWWQWVPVGAQIDAVNSGDPNRIVTNVLAGTPAAVGAAKGLGGASLGFAASTPLAAAERTLSSAKNWLDADSASKTDASNSTAADGGKAILKGNDWATATAIGTLGLGALGLGGYGIYKWLQARDEDKARASKMKMRIKTPNGDDAVVEMPLVNPNMSPQLESDFNRGVTRGVRQIARHNSFKRDPQTGKLMSYKDWYDQYGRLEEQGMSNGVEHQEKAAKVVGIPTINLLENTVPKAKETPWRPVVPGKVRQMLDLEKAASRARQTNEGIGSITAPLLAAALLGGGAKLMGASNGAALGAAGAGAIGAPLLGAAVSSFTPDRAQSEQSNIDADGNGWENIVVPGLAQYNMLQRARVLPDALAVNVRKATGDPMPDLDGDGEPDVIPERMTITSDNLLSLDDSDFGMYSKK